MPRPRMLEVVLIDDQRKATAGRQVIGTWLQAQRFWRSRSTDQRLPDMVLVDVNFEDDKTDPLCFVDSVKPTGLLLALPFLSIARARGVPMVLQYYTRDKNRFGDLTSSLKPSEVFMGWLAASLAGLSSSLVDSTGVEPNEPLDGDAALGWIKTHTARNPEEAYAAAVALFRKLLFEQTLPREGSAPLMVIDPSQYEILISSVRDLARRPPGNPGVKDLAIRLIRSDGSTDSLLLHSLFHPRDSLDLAEPVELGAESAPDDNWLSAGGRGRLGEYVFALGGWPGIYRRAASVADSFSANGEPPRDSINDVVHQRQPYHKLTRLLVVLFQANRLYLDAQQRWERLYWDHQWDPRTMTFGSRSEMETLAACLTSLFESFLRASSVEPTVTHDDLLAQLAIDHALGIWDEDLESVRAGQLPSFVSYHIDLLVQVGLIEAVEGGLRRRLGPEASPRERIPPRQRRFEAEAIKSPLTGLGRSLGAKPGDEAQLLRRIIGDALFGSLPHGEREAAGTQFLRDMLDSGALPQWLRLLAATHATQQLYWANEAAWPAYLRAET